MWELDHTEVWEWKNWYFHHVVLKKTLENPLDSRGIKLVNPKGNQPSIFIGRVDAEAETPILGRTDVKSQLIEDPDAEKYWGQEDKGATEDEMVGWHHWLNGHTFEQTQGDSERQGNLVWTHTEMLLYFWDKYLVSQLIYTCFLPFCRFYFHFVYGFLWCAKDFKFN